MTGTHQILQTKLNELETILNEGILRGPESDSHEDIKTKLSFIQTLLSAEVASSDSTKPHHLVDISDRLVSMEKSFHEWDSQRIITSEDFEKDNSISSCSCTESCLNDDGEETLEDKDSGMTIYDNPLVDDSWNFDDGETLDDEDKGNGVSENCENEKERFNLENDDKVGFFVYEDAKDDFFEDFVKDNKEVVEMEREDSELGSEEEGSEKSGTGKNCCSMASGVVIGMILMSFIMVNFSDCFYYYDDDEQASFAFPT